MEGARLTKTLSLPTDGRTIYVVLWSLINGQWQYANTYSYTALDGRAKMTSPADGSALTGASATFTWSIGIGVSKYALWIGNAPMTYDLYAKDENTALTDTVALPADGRPIYVTLWSMMSGAWKSNSYSYTAPDNKAKMISPPSGSTLTSGTVTFTWTTGTGVSQYALWAGSTRDSHDLYAAVVTGTSTTVTLPTDRRPIYVRLYSMINGAWAYNSHTYTALDNKAKMTSPAGGSTLSAASTTFQWSLGTGASQYALWVGSSSGSYDFYAAIVTGTSTTVTLPQDGRRIYVRLWSMMNGEWKFNGCTYNGFTGTDLKARMISPPNRSTLTSAATTFTWTAGTGVTPTAIWVGSTLDSHDLYAAVVTGTSKAITLPTDGRPLYVNPGR